MTLGNMLRERDVQYTALKDEVTNTWRILDTWSDDLKNLSPDYDIPDDSKAVTILTEGGFLELSTAGAGIDTKLYLYATCDDVDIDIYPYGNYIAYNDDFGSSVYGTCPDCTYWGESYIYVGVPAGDYIIVS